MDMLAIGLFLALVNQKVVDYLSAPIRQQYPNLNMWWLLYVAAATGFVIAWLSGVNLFEAYVPNESLARVLSGIVVGGGSSLIHDVFDKPAGEVYLSAEFSNE